MVLAKAPAPDHPQSSWIRQLRSLAIILSEEFGVTFHFFDAATGGLLEGIVSDSRPGTPPSATVRAAESPKTFDQANAARLAGEGVARVQTLEGARYQLALPFADAGQPTAIAVAVIAVISFCLGQVLQSRSGNTENGTNVRDRPTEMTALQQTDLRSPVPLWDADGLRELRTATNALERHWRPTVPHSGPDLWLCEFWRLQQSIRELSSDADESQTVKSSSGNP